MRAVEGEEELSYTNVLELHCDGPTKSVMQLVLKALEVRHQLWRRHDRGWYVARRGLLERIDICSKKSVQSERLGQVLTVHLRFRLGRVEPSCRARGERSRSQVESGAPKGRQRASRWAGATRSPEGKRTRAVRARAGQQQRQHRLHIRGEEHITLTPDRQE